jgi:beta-barrel assembly-enhancing protease
MINITCQRDAAAFTIGEEKEVGEKLLFTVRSAFQILDDPDIHQYITSLGQEVLEVAGVQFFDYHFFVIKNKEFNAFAAPSGLIFFHSGLIETMNSEDELISVVAHEVGHIVKRHLASRLEKSKIVNVATLGLALASLALGSGEGAQALVLGSFAAGQSINLKFSRYDEEEADLMAYGWMKKLGRNPKGQDRMLQTMRRITRYRMGQVPQYLLTHPDPEARMDYVQSLLEADDDKLTNESKENQFAFLRFKYRILSMVKSGTVFREFLASKIADPRGLPLEKVMAKYGMSQLNRLEKNYPDSLKLLSEVIQVFPQETILQVDKGIIEFESGQLDNALKTLTNAYKSKSWDSYAAFGLGKVYFSKSDHKNAEKYFLEVAETMPEYSQVYFELGQLKARQKHNAEASFYLGKYYLYEGKLKLSTHSFKAAVANKNINDKFKKEAEESLELLERLQEK